jgi:prenyltransferase beta subunit
MRWRCGGFWNALLIAAIVGQATAPLRSARADQDLSAARVKESIRSAQQFLMRVQNPEGSYGFGGGPAGGHASGATALVMLALLTSGVPADDPSVVRGLRFLRHVPDPQYAYATYQQSLMLMTFSAAHQWDTDRIRMTGIASQLEDFQVKDGGPTSGMWNYGLHVASEDNSNTQFAILGLREAAIAGIKIGRKTWERTLEHFLKTQNEDGGWGYQINQHSTGSMTCAGIGSIVICEQMLGSNGDDTNADGSPKCCDRNDRTTEALRRAQQWLSRYFAVGVNPGEQGGRWVLYYLYGIERAGRLSGQRFFGNHDWYREGAAYLIERQSRRDGSWSTSAGVEADPLIGSSFALLFLSKGLAPVLINKLNYGGPAQPPNWNLHPNDARNLTDYVSGLPKWPKLLTYQQVDLDKVEATGSVRDLLQAPILYLSGRDEPKFTEPQVKLLRAYIEQGGFIFAVDNCNGAGFDEGIKNLVARIYPGDAQLKRLPPEHPIYRSEFPLDPEGTELLGVDFGCRTSFVYAPRDHSCLWDKWSLQPVPNRTAAFNLLVLHAMKVGANVVAYATGREPYDKLDAPNVEAAGPQDHIQRGLLQVAKLRHTGDWDAAPRALYNVLMALNERSGVKASTRQKNLLPSDPQLRRYPLAYMHGRATFELGPQEIQNLRKYLQNGAVLFADSCCGSPQFDKSFREMVHQIFPDKKLERIPITHELFSSGIGFPIQRVKRRIPQSGNANDPLDSTFKEGEPYLEGIEVNGRYCVIYSKYDLSCALERQASVACAGYDHADAVRIAFNVIRYALLQDLSYAGKIK